MLEKALADSYPSHLCLTTQVKTRDLIPVQQHKGDNSTGTRRKGDKEKETSNAALSGAWAAMTVTLAAVLCLLATGHLSGWARAQEPSIEDRLAKLETNVKILTRQAMMTELSMQEKNRNEGDSGLQQIRLKRDGTKSYLTTSYSDYSMASIHNHANLLTTLGMGELAVTLNGVHFRTRHNDYRMDMPAINDKTFHMTEPVPLPPVPTSVTSKASVEEQIVEMQEWFKAWQSQDHSVRDYREYFRPTLVYLEGAWLKDNANIDEPFESDRHALDAKTWLGLLEKIRFSAASGSPDTMENLAFLPTSITEMTESGDPVMGQFNYRILAHPIEGDKLKLGDLKLVDNLPNRLLKSSQDYQDYAMSNGARFRVAPYSVNRPHKWNLLDTLMKQVPGKDNYGASITGLALDGEQRDVFDDTPLNTANYRRWSKAFRNNTNTERFVHAGFADSQLFVAETTNPEVMPVPITRCWKDAAGEEVCVREERRFSWAIPLEVVYRTPLHDWNPYGITYKGKYNSVEGKTVKAGNRDGLFTTESAFNGINDKTNYQTPSAFFEPLDERLSGTGGFRRSKGVLDSAGNLRSVMVSGFQIILPPIPGVGQVRIRYPIMPVASEGSPVGKELEALRDVLMNVDEYRTLFQVAPPFAAGNGSGFFPTKPTSALTLQTNPSDSTQLSSHSHKLYFNANEANNLKNKGKTVKRVSSHAEGHEHYIKVDYIELEDRYVISTCDELNVCFDGHPEDLIVVTE